MRMCHWTRWPLLAGGNHLRPLQRSVYVLVVWTCLCYGLFQISSHGSGDSSSSGGGAVYAGAGPVNSRLLLQKVTETPLTSTAASSGVAAIGTQPITSTDPAGVKIDRQNICHKLFVFCSHFHNDANVLDEDIIQYNA